MPRAQRISVAKFNMESGYEQGPPAVRAGGGDQRAVLRHGYHRHRCHPVLPQPGPACAQGCDGGLRRRQPCGRVAYVPLTSAHLHYRTAGDKAARLLLDQLADPHARPRELELGWELKCRASTGDENADENIWAL